MNSASRPPLPTEPKAPTPGPFLCAHCRRPLPAGAAVPLWDRRPYCVECVEAACPGLADFARTHDWLEEKLPFPAWRLFAGFLVTYTTAIVAIFGLSFVLWGWLFDVDVVGVLLQPLLYLFLGGVLALVMLLVAVGHVLPLAIKRPFVCARNGRLHLGRGDQVRASHSLRDCEWFLGNTWQVDQRVPCGPAFVLIFPKKQKQEERYALAGYSAETRRRWAGFLGLAGVPQRQPWQKSPSRFRPVVQAALLVLMFPISFGLFYLLGRGVSTLLLPILKDQGAATLIGGWTFLLGAVAGFYHVWYFAPNCLGSRVSSRRPCSQVARIWSAGFLAWVLFGGVMALLTLMMTEYSFFGRTVGGCYCILLCALIGIVFGYQLSAYDWELARPIDALKKIDLEAAAEAGVR